jgi:predicted esterase
MNMKKLLFVLGLLPLFGCSKAAAPESPERLADEAYVSYFEKRLNGEDHGALYTAGTALTADRVALARDTVWNSWRAANRAFAEDKLIALNPLNQTHSGRFDLTAYEPKAIMPYYYGTKGAARPEAGWPLFVYMHGSGPKESEWNNGFVLGSRFGDAPSAYFIPQIPNEGGYYRWWQRAKQEAWERLLRQAYLSGEIDPNRVYFFGISEGAYGSQRLASFYADYLAAAGPIAGGEPLENAPAENCANIGFSLRTGANDLGFCRNELTQAALEEFDRLEAEHPGYYEHNIQVVPGATHTSIDYNPTTPWMKNYTRNPWPKYFFWEDFAMDGRYRDGFYNLAVVERSDDGSARSCYEMTIADNTVDLKVSTMTAEVTARTSKWDLPLKWAKTYTPATKGRVIVYLNDKLVDLSRPVKILVNGREAFNGMVELNTANLVNSCATFFDPERLFPAAVEVTVR